MASYRSVWLLKQPQRELWGSWRCIRRAGERLCLSALPQAYGPPTPGGAKPQIGVHGIAEHRVAVEPQRLRARSRDGTGTSAYSALVVASLQAGTSVPHGPKPRYRESPVFPTEKGATGTTTKQRNLRFRQWYRRGWDRPSPLIQQQI